MIKCAPTGQEETDALTSRGFWGAALLLALVILGMVALSRRVSPKESQNTTSQVCRDVGTLEKTITDVRAGTVSGEQAMARIDQAQQAFALDAQHDQSPLVAPHVASIAIDIADWRTALFSGDAAGQAAALNHARSELASLPVC